MTNPLKRKLSPLSRHITAALVLALCGQSAQAEYIQFGDATEAGDTNAVYIKFLQIPGGEQASSYAIILPHGTSNQPQLVEAFDLQPVMLNSGAYIYCKNGSTTVANASVTNVSDDLSDSQKTPYTGTSGEPLLKTTIPGLFFSLSMSDPSTSVFTNPRQIYYFPFSKGAPVWNVRADNSGCGRLSDARLGDFTFKSRLRFYVNNEFNPYLGNSQQLTGLFEATLQITSGTQYGSAKLTFSFQGFTVSAPTCLSSVVTSSESGALTPMDATGTAYSIALGDYSPSDVRNEKTKKVPFTIQLSGCTAVNQLEVAVDGTTSPGTNYFANKNTGTGAAQNVAVRLNELSSSPGNEVPFFPGRRFTLQGAHGALGPSLINRYNHNVIIGTGMPGSFNIDFNSQLVAADASKAVGPGTFTAKSTILFNYP